MHRHHEDEENANPPGGNRVGDGRQAGYQAINPTTGPGCHVQAPCQTGQGHDHRRGGHQQNRVRQPFQHNIGNPAGSGEGTEGAGLPKVQSHDPEHGSRQPALPRDVESVERLQFRLAGGQDPFQFIRIPDGFGQGGPFDPDLLAHHRRKDAVRKAGQAQSQDEQQQNDEEDPDHGQGAYRQGDQVAHGSLPKVVGPGSGSLESDRNIVLPYRLAGRPPPRLS